MARTHAPRSYQSTCQSPQPSWHWLTAWQAEHLARGGQPTYGARDVAIEQWGLGATTRSAAATTVAVQALETRLALESGIANALCAARAATAQVTS
jgi:hypothetical protein